MNEEYTPPESITENHRQEVAMTTKKPGASQSNTRHRRGRKPSPTKGWFSLEQRARFKGQKEQV